MMQPKFVELPAKHVAGIDIRTTNQDGMEAIAEMWNTYYSSEYPQRTPGKIHPSVSLGVYSDYESNETGAYTLMAGTEIASPDLELPEGMKVQTLPAAKYAVFTSRKGPLAEVVTEVWARIWEWSHEPGNKRAFTRDFEWYDERSLNMEEAQVDIYIAVE